MLTTIKKNSKGDLVKAAQYLMSSGTVKTSAGVFSDAFAADVAKWQKAHGLTADKIIGPNTWTALSKAAPTVRSGSKGNAVSALQVLLGGLSVDGSFGPKTKAAVVAYQSAHSLSADGIAGPKTWGSLIVGSTASGKKFKQPVDYKQYDSKWAGNIYTSTGNKSQTMKNSGCGPTACADVVATLIDKTVTPWTLAQLAMKWGDRTANDGTAWAFFKHVFNHYKGFSKFIQTSSLATMKACLDAGGYVVCSMGPGYWTGGGHFICAWKYDGTYIYCNDPASSTRKKQKEADFKKQARQYFCFYR